MACINRLSCEFMKLILCAEASISELAGRGAHLAGAFAVPLPQLFPFE